MLQDSENGFPLQFGEEMMSNFGALMEASMERKKKRKATWEGGGKAFLKSAEEGEREFGFYFKKRFFLSFF